MRVLWLTNMMMPEAIGLLGGNREFRSSGGWLLTSAEFISTQESIELFIITPSPLVKRTTSLNGKRIIYFIIPFSQSRAYCQELEPVLRELDSVIHPDIVHIHGTEFPLGLAYVRACPDRRTVISMQGLCLPIGKNYCRGLTKWQILKSITLRDIIRRDTIFDQATEFIKYGETIERELISGVKDVIGRTSFDKEYVQSINPKINYYKCNETLREQFYSGKWTQEACEKHTLFLSSASYPIKGAHQLFAAMSILIQRYPNIKLRIAGNDITKRNGIIGFFRYHGYGKILRRLIHKYRLDGHVYFLGNLTAEEMKKEYLKCNAFICASSCENSPNSLGEAQILGVPCVATAVGGVPSMVPNKDCGYLVDFDVVEEWVEAISCIFNGDFYNLEIEISLARERHCKEENRNTWIRVYREMLSRV